MTLICQYIWDMPALIGDALLTSPSYKNDDIPLLTHINEHLTNSPYGYVAGLAQKASVISPTLAIAWTGDFRPAEYLLKLIAEEEDKNPLTPREIEEVLCKGLPKASALGNVTLVGMSTTGIAGPSNEQVCFPFGYNAACTSRGPLHALTTEGSGRKIFFDALEANVNGPPSPPNFPRGIALALKATSMLMNFELRSGRTLKQGFGANYDIITVDRNEGLCNVGPRLQLLWELGQLHNRKPYLWLMPFMIRTSYRDHVSLNQIIRLQGSIQANDLAIAWKLNRTICPIFRDYPVGYEIVDPSVDVNFISNAVLVRRPIFKGSEETGQFDLSGRAVTLPIGFSEKDGVTYITLSNVMLDCLLDAFVEFFKIDRPIIVSELPARQ